MRLRLYNLAYDQLHGYSIKIEFRKYSLNPQILAKMCQFYGQLKCQKFYSSACHFSIFQTALISSPRLLDPTINLCNHEKRGGTGGMSPEPFGL